MAGIEGGYRPRNKEAAFQAGSPQGARRELLEVHYDGAPTVIVFIGVDGRKKDVPHLHIDQRGGQTRWWVERESIAAWQQRVHDAHEKGEYRFRDIPDDDTPSRVTHSYQDGYSADFMTPHYDMRRSGTQFTAESSRQQRQEEPPEQERDFSHEQLVDNIRGLLEKARQERVAVGGTFDPIVHLWKELQFEAFVGAQEPEGTKLAQESRFYWPLFRAWGFLTFEHYDEYVQNEIRFATTFPDEEEGIVLEDPRQAALFTALTEATDIPYERGEPIPLPLSCRDPYKYPPQP